MNGRWLDVAGTMLAEAGAELRTVQAQLAALPVHAPTRVVLALRAGDLAHRVATAAHVLDAYGCTAPATLARVAA